VASARFAIFGVGGFVARRHLEAIQKVGGELVAAVDPHDSVGILDRFTLDARYFKEERSAARYLGECASRGRGVDYVVVCSPNDLHAGHIELGLDLGADVICEKPLVTRASDFARVSALARERGRKVHPVLQLRHHPALLALAKLGPSEQTVEVELDYVTPRGAWYDASWKGDPERSGGLLANIGIHFLDVLLWLYGDVVRATVLSQTARTIRGRIELERAKVTFRLSIDPGELELESRGQSSRKLCIQGRQVVLETDLEGLHEHVYRAILAGAGLELPEARPALDLCFALRSQGVGSRGAPS
jgi:UDP-N-acetyl-2-amino-2-deoxyglucuronate dehydrogenase